MIKIGVIIDIEIRMRKAYVIYVLDMNNVEVIECDFMLVVEIN
jgi:hypothetical protein